jgi:hypothetical protein
MTSQSLLEDIRWVFNVVMDAVLKLKSKIRGGLPQEISGVEERQEGPAGGEEPDGDRLRRQGNA